MPFVEVQRWCLADGLTAQQCRDPPGYHTFGLGFLSRESTLVMEACVVALLVLDLWLRSLVRGWAGFSRRKDRAVHASLLAAVLVDITVAASLLRSSPSHPPSWRLTPYLRVLLLTSYTVDMQISHVLTWGGFGLDLLKVLVPLALVVFFFAWSGVLLFKNTSIFFHDFSWSLWSMADLVTTNNFPDVMVGVVDANRVNFTFFFAFLVLGIWLLLPSMVAVICGAYTTSRQSASQVAVENRRQLLGEGFEFLDVNRAGALNVEQLARMLTVLHSFGGPASGDGAWQAVVFAILDRNGQGTIDRKDFDDIPRILALSLRPIQEPWLELRAPGLWAKFGFHRVRELIKSGQFERLMCVVLSVSLFTNIVASLPFLMGQRRSQTAFAMWATAPFVGILLGEVLLKLLMLGIQGYWISWKNRFDAITTGMAALAFLYVFLGNGFDDPGPIQVSLMICTFRAARLVGASPFFKSVSGTAASVKPKLLHVLPRTLCAFLLFDVLGCDVFGGLICSAPGTRHYERLKDTDYGRGGYWPLNFNDPASGMLTLISVFVVNNMDKYVEAFMDVSCAPSCAYFVVWYLLGNCALLNLVTSVAIDAFVAQGPAQQGSKAVHRCTFDPSVVTGTATGVSGLWRAQLWTSRGSFGGEGQVASAEELVHLTRPEPWCDGAR